MPFRARMKRAFTRSSSSGSSSNSSSSLSKVESRGIGDPKIYQPGEAMPRPKYRAPVDKKHKAMLDSFSFNPSSRRRSADNGSLYSPMGSRMPSRNNSVHRSQSWWAPSAVSGAVDENEMVMDDVSNVGDYSISQSTDVTKSTPMSRRGSLFKPANVQHVENADATFPSISTPDHDPFSAHQLRDALAKSVARNQTVPETL